MQFYNLCSVTYNIHELWAMVDYIYLYNNCINIILAKFLKQSRHSNSKIKGLCHMIVAFLLNADKSNPDVNNAMNDTCHHPNILYTQNHAHAAYIP